MEATGQLILFTEAFLNDGPAKTFPAPASKPVYRESDPDYGSKCSAWSEKYALVGSWLKTFVERSISPSIPFAPVWRMKDTSSGRSCFLLLRLERRTGENGSSSSLQEAMWPTPRANDSEKRGCVGDDQRNGLPSAVLWPTPSVKGNHNRRGSSETSGDGLATAVNMWPTPPQRDWKGANGPKHFASRDRPHMSQLPNAVLVCGRRREGAMRTLKDSHPE